MPRPGVCCVIGAGDATGSAVARRFAKEGYTVCAARRTATALKPLVDQITVEGGKAVAFGLDARREDQVVNFFHQIEAEVGPVEVLLFNVGGNVRFPVLETTHKSISKSGKCVPWPAFWQAARPPGSCCHEDVEHCSLLAPRPVCAALQVSRRLPVARRLCGRSLNPWRGNWVPRGCMLRMW